MVDYKILEDIPHYGQDREDLERRYMCASFGLFYVKGSGDLVPIAIQLHQQPSPDNPIWTPNDSDLDWIYAKFWLRNADTQYHQVTIHMFPFNGDLKILSQGRIPGRDFYNTK